ncbi:MAG: hydrogenase expression/formation protein HypE [Melioribacteraceae bacterium]
MNDKLNINFSCPVQSNEYDKILMAHGGGGTYSKKLLEQFIYPMFDNNILSQRHDSGIFEISKSKFAFTTDSFVVSPIFFPGGDIGKLAINGTINDLSVAGAKPLFISLSFIIEEGFPIKDFQKILLSIKSATEKANVKIITGDTKVVEKGSCDKIFINTSGIGIIENGIDISPAKCKVGDKIILSGGIAEHGIAILTSRNNFEIETDIESDTSPLNHLVEKILSVSKNIHMMRDPTRGGLSSCLNEIAQTASVSMLIYEDKIPVKEEVRSICELLGLDPLYIANEGKIVVIVDPDDADSVLQTMRQDPLGQNAQIIGEIIEDNSNLVFMKTIIGTTRIVDMISGEQLPRIC